MDKIKIDERLDLDVIRNQRRIKNMTQQDLGERLGLTRQSINNMENAKTILSLTSFRRLIVALDLNEEETFKLLNVK